MVRVLLRRLLGAFATLLLLASLVFGATRLLPGDITPIVLGEEASPADRARLRARLHLDESRLVQVARFTRDVVVLDWGTSLRRPGERCLDRVREAAKPTAALAFTAVGLGAFVGLALAVLTTVKRSDMLRRALDLVAATPLLAFAPVATWLLAWKLRLVPLPGDPEAGLAGLLFAAGLLALPLAAHLARLTVALLEPLREGNSLRLVRAKGATELRVWVAHALPQVASTVVVIVGAQLGALLGGAVVLERLFERPGLGLLALEAWQARDLPMLEAAVIGSGALFVATQVAAGLVASLVDVRSQEP
jgi:peptide/nickel transport system permease protein